MALAGQPSNCLCLKNMFSSNDPEISNPNSGDQWKKEMEEDIEGECKSFGPVEHVGIDRYSHDGSVYIRFSQLDAATAAFENLDGRWFSGLKLSAHYIPQEEYLAKYPAH